jgi:hypothetical protein
MKTRFLLLGISTVALSANAVSAQNTNITDATAGVGNTTICSNGGPGSSGNACNITQVGANNSGTITQPGGNNFSRITTTGSVNLADHRQNGNFNSSTTAQTGNANTSTIFQSGDYHRASVSQTGNGSSSNHVSSVRQAGNNSPGSASTGGNSATVTQRALAGSIGAQQSSIQQVGTGNSASVTQDGATNSATIIQGTTTSPTGVPSDSSTGTSNIAIIVNGGAANRSAIDQSGGSGGPVGPPVVTVGGRATSMCEYVPVAQNVMFNYAYLDISNDPSTPGLGSYAYNGNQGSITQRSSNNKANVILRGGGIGTNANSATVMQSNSLASSTTASRNEAFVSLSQGNHMRGDVIQNGFDNFADVTMTSGVSGTDPVTGRSGTNSSLINQAGRGQSAVVTVGSRTQFQGLGNQSLILQAGVAAFLGRVLDLNGNPVPQPGQSTTESEGRIAYTEGGSAGNFSGSRGNYVEVWQQGRFDSASVLQSDGINSARTYSDGTIARARAGIYQSSQQGLVSLVQLGDNYGDITQALGTYSLVSLVQVDAGDIEIVPPFPGTPSFSRQYNQALVTQYGDDNVIAGFQNTRNGYLSLFQRQGSVNNLIVAGQGTGATEDYAEGTQQAANDGRLIRARVSYVCGCGGGFVGSPLSPTPPTGAATHTLTQNITQGGINNAVRVEQDATNSFVTVTQLGSGVSRSSWTDFLGFGNTVGNQIQVAQQGNNNRVFATQTATVGASDASGPASGNDAATNAAQTGNSGASQDEFYFAGGARSPEIDILQAGADNVAIAEQRGRGQYARIDQGPGTGNVASILQQATATNATALIRQTGSFNSYYVVQTQPGHYITVEQTGNNNTANSVAIRGTGGSNGFTPPSP